MTKDPAAGQQETYFQVDDPAGRHYWSRHLQHSRPFSHNNVDLERCEYTNSPPIHSSLTVLLGPAATRQLFQQENETADSPQPEAGVESTQHRSASTQPSPSRGPKVEKPARRQHLIDHNYASAVPADQDIQVVRRIIHRQLPSFIIRPGRPTIQAAEKEGEPFGACASGLVYNNNQFLQNTDKHKFQFR